MIPSRLEERARSFLSVRSLEDHRFIRQEASVQLRKQNRLEKTKQRRAKLREEREGGEIEDDEMEFGESWETGVSQSEMQVLRTHVPQFLDPSLPFPRRLHFFLDVFISSADSLYPPLLTILRHLISSFQFQSSPQLYRPDLLSKLISTLDSPDRTLVHWSLFCLTNLAAGPSELLVGIESFGILSRLYAFVTDPDIDISDLAIWTLSNLAVIDSIRQNILTHDILPICLDLFHSELPTPQHDMANMLSLFLNLINSDTPPSDEVLKLVMSVVPWALAQEKEDVITNGCWICEEVSNKGEVEIVLSTGVLGKLMELLVAPSPCIVTPVLRTVGNIVAGNDAQTQMVLEQELLQKLHALINHSERSIRKDTIWCLSNITAGTVGQTLQVVQHPIMTKVMHHTKDIDMDLRREATYTVANVFCVFSFGQMKEFSMTSVLDALTQSLDYNDAELLKVTLEALKNLLEKEQGAGEKEVRSRFDQLDGQTALEKLMMHPNKEVYDQVSGLIHDLFDSDEVPRPSIDSTPPISHFEFA